MLWTNTLWRDLLWPSLTFDQYHCTFLYTSNFQWMKYKPDETMGRGNMLWTGIYREMWFDLLFVFIWIRLLHIHYPFKLYEGNLIQIGSGEHKIYSEHDFDIGETNCNKSPTNQGNIIMRSMHGPQQPPKYNTTV